MSILELLCGLTGILLATFGMYSLIRNDWVSSFRISLLYSDFETFKKLPSYEEMLWKYFYIWSKEKFLKMAHENTSV